MTSKVSRPVWRGGRRKRGRKTTSLTAYPNEPVSESLARGPIRREVTRVVTPGTVIEEGKSNSVEVSEEMEEAQTAEERLVRQSRHFVLKQFEAWLKETGLAFVAIEDIRRTTPAVAPYVGVLDFIVLRGDEKLLVTVRPQLLAKHLQAVRELQNLFGPECKPTRMWPSESLDGWIWHEYAVDLSTPKRTANTERPSRRNRSRASKRQ